MRKLTIAVDFDGTIVTQNWPHIGDLIPGALPALQEWTARGHTIIIWTCRAGKQLDECKAWLKAHRIPYHHVNANTIERIQAYGGDTRKVSADLYIDDKALCSPRGKALWLMARREVKRMEGPK